MILLSPIQSFVLFRLSIHLPQNRNAMNARAPVEPSPNIVADAVASYAFVYITNIQKFLYSVQIEMKILSQHN